MLEILPVLTPSIRPKHRGAFHCCGSKMQNCEQAGPNAENMMQLALAGVNLPEIYAGNPLGVHAVDSTKTSVGIPLLWLEDAKL
jgi:hypothetical protein